MAQKSKLKVTPKTNKKPKLILSVEASIRSLLVEQIQSAIDTASEQDASADFTAGLEVALAIITDTLNATPEELENVEA